MGFCNCFMFCCALLYAHSSFAIILIGKRELVDLLSLSSLCLVVVMWLFFAVPWVSLQFVIVVFADHTNLFSLASTFSRFLPNSVTLLDLQYADVLSDQDKPR